MFRNLIPSLAHRYCVLAHDHPGFGHSSMPPRGEFAYTFDNLAGVVEEFTTILGLSKHALYEQDCGAPVGYQLASRYPDRVTAIWHGFKPGRSLRTREERQYLYTSEAHMITSLESRRLSQEKTFTSRAACLELLLSQSRSPKQREVEMFKLPNESLWRK